MSYETDLQANNLDLQALIEQAQSMPSSGEVLSLAQAYTNENAAPAGYGLGIETPALVSNCNNAVNNGWYQVTGAENLPVGYSDGWIFVSSFNDKYKRQDFYSELFNGIHAVRYMNKSIWGEWDWVNPIVGAGREYRTIERHKGKPVYVRLFDCGYFPSETQKEIEHGISNIENILRVEATSDYLGLALPYAHIPSTGILANAAAARATQNGICIFATNSAWSSYKCYVTLYYTKTTD